VWVVGHRGRKRQIQLKTAYRKGTTHCGFKPLDTLVRLAASVPKPRANLPRFHAIDPTAALE
jgi:hypothetical protein